MYLCAVCLWMGMLGGCASAGADRETEGSTRQSGGEEQEIQKMEDLTSGEGEDAQIVFEGLDMEGNTVSSDIFSQSRLTMINVWATYCNPCLSEMPGLGELAGEYDAADFQLIGIVSDVLAGEDQDMTEYAADLIQRTGANYRHLLLNESLYYALLTDVTAVPTTFFLDENGVILDTVIGARDKAAWKEKIDAFLEE